MYICKHPQLPIIAGNVQTYLLYLQMVFTVFPENKDNKIEFKCCIRTGFNFICFLKSLKIFELFFFFNMETNSGCCITGRWVIIKYVLSEMIYDFQWKNLTPLTGLNSHFHATNGAESH